MTKLLYLEDTKKYTAGAVVLNIDDDEYGTFLVLDQTIFYPQGGGQPADQGKIVSNNNTFKVEHVVLTPDAIVKHYGQFDGESFNSLTSVILEIDEERRILNSKLHSAGHLLDCAVMELGLPLKPTKGFHFPEGTYVEYEGILDNGSQYVKDLETVINELVNKGLTFKANYLNSDEACKKGIIAPEGKAARFVHVDGFDGCGCGGTHVKSTNELGRIIIRKIKSKKGNTKISYALEDYLV